MKILSRDFTITEKILIAILCLVIVGLAYYQFVHKPVEAAIDKANAEKAALSVELDAVEKKIAELEAMKADLDRILADPTINPMPSYNAVRDVRTTLYNLLGDMSYKITFKKPEWDNNTSTPVRRPVEMSFTAPDYSAVEKMITGLESSEIRCKIADVRASRVYGYNYFTGKVIGAENPDALNVNLSLTFYETMYDGKRDADLPQPEPEAES